MKKSKIICIHIHSLTWFDKVNGNSYFSSVVSVYRNGKNRPVEFIKLPFQYGHGSQPEHEAKTELINLKYIQDTNTLWRYCDEKGIILISTKTDATKAQVKEYGK